MSFQQALPRLTQLAESADFVAAVSHVCLPGGLYTFTLYDS